MKEIKNGLKKFIISTAPTMKGCNIVLPAGITTAFISLEILETLIKEIKEPELHCEECEYKDKCSKNPCIFRMEL